MFSNKIYKDYWINYRSSILQRACKYFVTWGVGGGGWVEGFWMCHMIKPIRVCGIPIGPPPLPTRLIGILLSVVPVFLLCYCNDDWFPFPLSVKTMWFPHNSPLPPVSGKVIDNRDLKQSGRQRQGRLRLKNEFLPLIRISKMAAFVYRLMRRHTSTSA